MTTEQFEKCDVRIARKIAGQDHKPLLEIMTYIATNSNNSIKVINPLSDHWVVWQDLMNMSKVVSPYDTQPEKAVWVFRQGVAILELLEKEPESFTKNFYVDLHFALRLFGSPLLVCDWGMPENINVILLRKYKYHASTILLKDTK